MTRPRLPLTGACVGAPSKDTESQSTMNYLSLPVLRSVHAYDLIVEENHFRVWRSRLTVEDGQPYNDQIIVEINEGGSWVIRAEFDPTANITKCDECLIT